MWLRNVDATLRINILSTYYILFVKNHSSFVGSENIVSFVLKQLEVNLIYFILFGHSFK